MQKTFLSISLAATAVLIGCASGNCRQMSEAPSKTAAPAPASTDSVSRGTTPAQPAATSQNVVVFKYDGSQQCGMGKALSAEEMEKELKGIPVVSREKRPDGLMRIQVCGAPTGMANLYTIPASKLADAEKRGFKTWTF